MTVLALTQDSSKTLWKEVTQIGLISLCLGLLGPLALPLPFTPVPVSLTSHAILLIAVLLGSKRASLAVLGYLMQGALGLPVFAKGGCGLAHLIGPTGGYLIGFLLAAYATGWIVERYGRKQTAVAMSLGTLLIYACGVVHLSHFLGFQKAVIFGCLPFLAGDLIKLLAAMKLSARVWQQRSFSAH